MQLCGESRLSPVFYFCSTFSSPKLEQDSKRANSAIGCKPQFYGIPRVMVYDGKRPEESLKAEF